MARAKVRRVASVPPMPNKLIRYTSPPPSPFAQFMQELGKLAFAEQWRSEGELVARGIPFAQVMTDGIWPVLLRMAEILSIAPETERRVQEVTRRIDRLVNLGLVLRYGKKMDLAAAAFGRSVVPVIESALSRLPEGTLARITPFWQEAAGKFFGDLVREVRQYGEELGALRRKIIEENRVSREWQLAVIDYIDDDKDMLPYLTLENDAKFSLSIIPYILTARPRLRHCLSTIAVLKRIPLKWERLPKDISHSERWLVGTTWINTQMLRAAAQMIDAEHLEGIDYAPALRAAQKLDRSVLVGRFFERLAKRGWKGTESDRAILTRFAEQSYKQLGEISDATITHITLSHCFLRVAIDDLMVEPSLAIPAAMGTDLGSARSRGQVRPVELLKKINWTGLANDEFDAIVDMQSLPSAMLVQGILKMPKSKQKAAAARLLESPSVVIERYLDSEALALLVEHQLVDLTDAFVLDFYELLSEDVLKKRLVAMVKTISGQDPALFVRLARSIPQEEARQIILEPRSRVSLALFIDNEILDSVRVVDRGLTSKEVAAFRKIFTSEQWTLLVLGDQLLVRDGAYLDTDKDLRSQFPIWKSALVDPSARQVMSEKLGRAVKANLMETYDEERVFRWLHEGRKNINRLWTEYCHRRDAYYRAFEGRKKRR